MPKEVKIPDEYWELWCQCENRNPNNVIYNEDGENPNCSKHCWVCGECGKIVQIG